MDFLIYDVIGLAIVLGHTFIAASDITSNGSSTKDTTPTGNPGIKKVTTGNDSKDLLSNSPATTTHLADKKEKIAEVTIGLLIASGILLVITFAIVVIKMFYFRKKSSTMPAHSPDLIPRSTDMSTCSQCSTRSRSDIHAILHENPYSMASELFPSNPASRQNGSRGIAEQIQNPSQYYEEIPNSNSAAENSNGSSDGVKEYENASELKDYEEIPEDIQTRNDQRLHNLQVLDGERYTHLCQESRSPVVLPVYTKLKPTKKRRNRRKQRTGLQQIP